MIYLLLIWVIVFIIMVFYLSYYKDKIHRLKVQVKSLENIMINMGKELNQFQLEKIYKSKNKIVKKLFKLDNILNEINIFGMKSLSKDKLNFLKNYKDKQNGSR